MTRTSHRRWLAEANWELVVMWVGDQPIDDDTPAS